MDFSHHPKLCTKTQHAQFNKNKPILKLAGLTLPQESSERAPMRGQRSGAAGAAPGRWKGAGGRRQLCRSGRAPFPHHSRGPSASARVPTAGAGADPCLRTPSHFFHVQFTLAMSPEHVQGRQGTHRTVSRQAAQRSMFSAPRRSAAATKADLRF